MSGAQAAQFPALIVGFTGGIGSGKSTVADAFHAEFGSPVIDADQIARDVVAKGEPALTQIAAHFGPEALLASGELNRVWLRQHVFADHDAKQWLNALLHPLIRQRLLDALSAITTGYVLLMAPLLLENQLDRYCDIVIVIDVPESTQIARASLRDQNTREQIQAVMAAQVSRTTRLQAADIVIDNELPLSNLVERISPIHDQLQQAAARKQRLSAGA